MTRDEIQQQIDADGGELIAVADLVPWTRNPRRNALAAKKVAEYVMHDGWGSPVLAQSESNRIIAGHTRWKAARTIGLKRIPVRFRSCDDRTAERLAMADNKLSEVSEWDSPGVAEILSAYDLASAELMGWTASDLEKLAGEVADFGPLDSDGEAKGAVSCPSCGHEFSP